MLAYVDLVASTLVLMLGVCILDGDFRERGQIATLVARLKRHEMPAAKNDRSGAM